MMHIIVIIDIRANEQRVSNCILKFEISLTKEFERRNVFLLNLKKLFALLSLLPPFA